jgi:hypothetical protein
MQESEDWDDLMKNKRFSELRRQWEKETVPSFGEFIAGVDEAIMDFLWTERSGALINLFLYFNGESDPLNPREFLQFWGSLSKSEEDYYLIASVQELRNEAKGKNE